MAEHPEEAKLENRAQRADTAAFEVLEDRIAALEERADISRLEARFPKSALRDTQEGHLHKRVGRLNVRRPRELTIASGLVDMTRGYHTIDTESDAASDNLAAIRNGRAGEVIWIQPDNDARTIIVKHNDTSEGTAGNRIFLNQGSDLHLDSAEDLISLMYDPAADSANGAWRDYPVITSGPWTCRDYLVDKGYFGTEGATITTANTTHTFKIFSVVESATDDGIANLSRAFSVEICGGDRYLEDLEIPDHSHGIHLYGSTGGTPGGTSGVVIGGNTAASHKFGTVDLWLHDLTLDGPSSGDAASVTNVAASDATHLHAYNVVFAKRIRADISGSELYDCSYDGGFVFGANNASDNVSIFGGRCLAPGIDFSGITSGTSSYWRVFGLRTVGTAQLLLRSNSDSYFNIHFRTDVGSAMNDSVVFADENAQNITLDCNLAPPANGGQTIRVETGRTIHNVNLKGIFRYTTGVTSNTTYHVEVEGTGECVGWHTDATFGKNGSGNRLEDDATSASINGKFTESKFTLTPTDVEINTTSGSSDNVVDSGTIQAGSVGIVSATSIIHDQDGDTKVDTEESADEDIIRFDAGGTEVLTIDSNSVDVQKFLALTAGAELTISSGAITATNSHHTVDTEADAASDFLISIVGGTDGVELTLIPANSARTVIVEHLDAGAPLGTRMIMSDFENVHLDDIGVTITFIYSSVADSGNGAWVEKSRTQAKTKLKDEDGDTRLELDDGTDDDTFRAFIQDTEVLTVDSAKLDLKPAGTSRVTVHNTGDILRLVGVTATQGIELSTANDTDALTIRATDTASGFAAHAIYDTPDGGHRFTFNTGVSAELDVVSGANAAAVITFGSPTADTRITGGDLDALGTRNGLVIQVRGTNVLRMDEVLGGGSPRNLSVGFSPFTDDTYDWGTSSLRWKDGYFSGTIRSASAPTSIQVGGSINCGTDAAADTSSSIDLSATNRALLLNRLTTAQRDALTPVNGMVIYNTTTGTFQMYESGAWVTAAVLTSAGQLQVPTTGSAAGILLGGDTQLYRGAANALYIPERLRVSDPSANRYRTDWTMTVNGLLMNIFDDTGGVYLPITIDITAFVVRRGSDSTQVFTVTGSTGRATLPITGINAGLLIGGDALLYRSAADTLRTPDALTVDGALNATSGDVDGAVTDASVTAKGKIEIATAAETTTGTDAARAVSPDGLAGSEFGERGVQFVAFGFTIDITTGDGAYYFHIDSRIAGMDLVDVHAEVITAGTTGTLDIQIANVTQSADILSTKLTVDSAETGSDTAATPAVIDGAQDDMQENDLLRIDIDAVHTTAPKGLIITLGFRLP